MLTTESFNALLKTLEEPPEHTIFIFATTDIHKVPLTIISRCQRFDFRRIELNEIKTLLKKIADFENILIDDESLTLIAKKADGALRDAESIFDQVVSFCGKNVDVKFLRQMLNLIEDDIYFTISDAVLEKNYKAAFEVSEKIYSNGWNYIDFINGLVEHFRNLSTIIITKTSDFIEASETQKTKYENYVDKFSEGDILRILSFLTKIQNELRIHQNQKLKVEISLVHLIGFEKSTTITELLMKANNIKSDIKKKTEFVNNSAQIYEVSKKTELLIPGFIIEKPQPGKNLPKEKKSDLVKTESKQDKDNIKNLSKKTFNIQYIQQNWDGYKAIITKERFTLGTLLQQTIPTSIENQKILVDVRHNEDLEILSSSSELLTKMFNQFYNSNLQMEFNHNKNIKVSDNDKNSVLDEIEDETFKNHPLAKSIIVNLGGKEIL
jgi:DNA polymerase-3 subunit gamma/tau